MTLDVDKLPPTQYLILEVLAARHRTGEPFWTFPNLGLITTMSSPAPRTYRAKLTDQGIATALSATYDVPVPTLAQAIETLPATDDEYLAWMRRRGIGHGAGIGTVISHIRHDLRKLLAGKA